MKILFTCGGTAGHINPAVALARMFQERQENCQVLFVGAKGGMEERLVPKEGFPLETVTISSFWRTLSPAGIRHNLKTLRNLSVSKKEAVRILDQFQPDLVVGTGGYASYPVVHEAARRGIPTAVHESNAVPGLTTQRLSKVADRVMVGYEESRAHYSDPEKVVVTGTPVRGDFFRLTRQQAREALGIQDDRPLLLSYWGSLGADVMNGYMTDFIRRELDEGPFFHHIHGAGRNYASMTKVLGGQKLPPEIRLLEYIYDMPVVMAAADLVLCRGGASTLSELTAIGKPAVIVPSPNVTNHHQEKNANVLAKEGGAVVLLEPVCSGETLYRTAAELLKDEQRRQDMSRAMAAMGNPQAAESIYETLLSLVKA
ncbi:MAG: undecaprenyldiphospho-muramoylpentapeptide beta-N-acetylglucosaminyltransferase [Evtepia sp.]|uniref:undecaprenyldiphospho-muramoylpentapeptide beta-N-acetylglucosaminyltransferase n=1 Tax=Evtepia sp. TaxID=2773933 RepID=UPI002A75678C|nr:undecaprenyldiphospho-muramoylpentapeptide beta-N-acetylglucosaminyltransferase [Evtepia sp.]MDY3013732.1 undecaprenyldiphospho-muramoylpentapeptide beta-N-acetylglucosaminyltransferase [Evtepia sp.]